MTPREIAPDSIHSRYEEESAHVIPMLCATENLESLSIVIDAVGGPCEPALDINWVFKKRYPFRLNQLEPSGYDLLCLGRLTKFLTRQSGSLRSLKLRNIGGTSTANHKICSWKATLNR